MKERWELFHLWRTAKEPIAALEESRAGVGSWVYCSHSIDRIWTKSFRKKPLRVMGGLKLKKLKFRDGPKWFTDLILGSKVNCCWHMSVVVAGQVVRCQRPLVPLAANQNNALCLFGTHKHTHKDGLLKGDVTAITTHWLDYPKAKDMRGSSWSRPSLRSEE